MKTSMDNPGAAAQVPALEPGDHLTRFELERRYEAMPHVKKAELIEGIVYMPALVRHQKHSKPHGSLIWWLEHYSVFTPGVEVGDNGSVRLDTANEPQPDGLMFVSAEHGGRVRISEDDYLEGSPELVAEISASTASFDLHTKLQMYRRHGVQEYIVWRVLDAAVDWFALRQGDYSRLDAGANSWYRSEFFPGLWLDAAALVRGDKLAVLQALEQGLASEDHAAFIQKLKSK